VTSERLDLDERLAKLAAEVPTRASWIFDTVTMRFAWANEEALTLWRAASLQALQARDCEDSESMQDRLARYRGHFDAGRSVVDCWTFRPGGEPLTLVCTVRELVLPNEHRAIAVETCPTDSVDLGAADRRDAEALRLTSAMITLFSSEGAVVRQNPAAERAFGACDEHRNSFVSRFNELEFAQSVLDRLRKGAVYRADVKVVTKQGVRWHAIQCTATTDARTGVRQVVVDQRDITEMKLAQEAIEASEQRFRKLYMQAPVGIFHTDAQGRCVFVNSRLCELTGMSDEEPLGFGWLNAIHPDDRARVNEEWTAMAAGQEGGTLELRYRPHGGRDVWVVFHVVPVHDPDGTLVGYVGAVSDVTTSVLSEQRFTLVFENSSDAHLLVDESGVILDCNQGAVRMHRAGSKSELIGRTPGELSPEYQPDGRLSSSVMHEAMERTTQDGSQRFEWTHLGRDGVLFTVEVSMTWVVVNGKRAFFSTAHDNSERKRIEQAIVRSREAALEASRLKSEFLANMSHEIRTPMNGVLGMLLLALDSELTSEQREQLSAAQGSAEGLLAILNDILDLSKIEARKLTIEQIPLSVDELLRGSLQDTAMRAHVKNLELVVTVAEQVPRSIVGDPLRLRQILTNLIGNAIKFTSQGQVVVSVSTLPAEHDTLLALRVTDTGIGISRERQEQVFDAFQQADNSTTRRFGGSGLGLTICKELTSLMGGHLTLESELGVGSTFAVLLPLREAERESPQLAASPALAGQCILVLDDHALARSSLSASLARLGARVLSASSAAEALAQVAGESLVNAAFIDHQLGYQDGLELPRLLRDKAACRDTRFGLLRSRERVGRDALSRAGFEFGLDKPVLESDLQRALTAPLIQTPVTSRHASLPARFGRAEEPVRALQVLVVEDHPVNAHFVCSLLRRQGHHVVHAGNGVSALVAVARQSFDVILMDMQMPEMDGLEATRRIRSAEKSSGGRVPIIALTANAMKGDEQECLAAGMDLHIAKPIDPALLLRTLARVAEARPREEVQIRPPLGDSAVTDDRAAPYARDELLRRAGGDPRFAAELIRMFVGTQEEMMRDIEAAVARLDCSAVRDASHRLKGALQLVCAGPAAAYALQLEKAARALETDPMARLVSELRGEMLRLRGALGDVSTPDGSARS
jgi:two-component system, sensor histidine kinase and response regulator